MKRREFNRLAIRRRRQPSIGKSSVCAGPRTIESCSCRSAAEKVQYGNQKFATHIQPNPFAAKVCRGQATVQDLLDVELSVGGQPRRNGIGQPLFDHNGGAPRGVAEL